MSFLESGCTCTVLPAQVLALQYQAQPRQWQGGRKAVAKLRGLAGAGQEGRALWECRTAVGRAQKGLPSSSGGNHVNIILRVCPEQ
jgi:hypothetical protein